VKNNKSIEALGLVAGALIIIAFIPQALSIWKTAPTPALAVSLPMYIILNIGIFCWIIYGIKIRAKPVIIANAITLFFSLSILIYKLIYG